MSNGFQKPTILTGDELRALDGVRISRGLSWERTAKDTWRAIRSLDQFSRCPLIIVRFATDGAILFRNEFDQEPQGLLVFDPARLEGGFAEVGEGDSDTVAAVFSKKIDEAGPDSLVDGIASGLAAARQRIAGGQEEQTYASCEVEPAAYGDDPDPGFWRILDQQTQNSRAVVAEQTVLNGTARGLAAVPRCKFGALETIDRAEIEDYGTIRGLISEYVQQSNPSHPLCIAVFGPPGSGKSFGVKQVVKSLSTPNVVPKTFNISQYSSYDELAKAFHAVKDIALGGDLPFIFFDEFDSAQNGKPLGWLASFLAPMHDGEFRDESGVHPIGKAIFVFAGGTASTREAFSRIGDSDFAAVKGPDFVGRLQGFINIMGPNRQHEMDDAYVLRRALVLRSNFTRSEKSSQLIDENGTLRIDPGVLRAMINTTTYKHGMRSMDAIVNMSQIGKDGRFNLTALPPRSQLDLHVDADEFLWLTQCERYLNMIAQKEWPESEAGNRIAMESGWIERVAEQVFKNVIKHRELENKDIRLPGHWADLSDEQKQSFRDSAIDIPTKLRAVNHGIRRIREGQPANIPDISDDELLLLAKLEHSRRCQYLRLNGYRYADNTDVSARKSSRLVAFEELPQARVNHYFQGIYAIPVVLRALGYEIYRMEEHASFSDPHLLDTLARLIHADYVGNEQARGKSTGTNESLVPYDELPADKIESNLDNAASIPKKLRRIGYRIVRRREGETVSEPPITDNILELARMEHSRWVWQLLMQGWVYNPGKKDVSKKTNPHILPWDQLDDNTKQLDIDTVKLIPKLLERAGYKAIEID